MPNVASVVTLGYPSVKQKARLVVSWQAEKRAVCDANTMPLDAALQEHPLPMAIGRLSMKVGKAGKAGPHAAYIAREGQYADRLERGEKLEAREAGNMPAWAQANPQMFWQAADAFERKNGTTYREMEIALPRELTPDQRLALVREFVRQEIGETHAYQWAIHTPTASDGQEQPHAHIMFSERQRDGIDRDPEQYFKRYNAKAPEKGGARKGYGPSAGETLAKTQRAAELKELRGRWEGMCNAHLARAGVEQRIDMRSHAERGTGLDPERKQLPSQWRGQGRAQIIEFRHARAELDNARQQLARVIPDTGAEVLNLADERRQRQAARVSPDLEQMNAAQLSAQIARLRPPAVHDLVEADPRVIALVQRRHTLERSHTDAQAAHQAISKEVLQWRTDHAIRAGLHDKGLMISSYLVGQEERLSRLNHVLKAIAPELKEATTQEAQAKAHTAQRITTEQAPARALLAKLESLHEQRVSQERAQNRQALTRSTQEREFKGLAAKRQMKVSGWADTGRQWQATPQPLRQLIEAYNATPEAAKAAFLERIHQLPELLRDRQQERGGRGR